MSWVIAYWVGSVPASSSTVKVGFRNWQNPRNKKRCEFNLPPLSAWLREHSWFLWLWLLGDGLSLCTPSRYQWTRNLTSFLDRNNAARCYVAFVCALVVLRSLPFLRISACSFGIVKTRPHISLFSSRSLVSRSCPGILPLWIIALFVVASTTRLPWRDPVHQLWSAPLILKACRYSSWINSKHPSWRPSLSFSFLQNSQSKAWSR